MLEAFTGRWRTGNTAFSLPPAGLPERYRGAPVLDGEFFAGDAAQRCAGACPADAVDPAAKTLDLGKCLFCGLCEEACGGKGIRFTPDPHLPFGARGDLVLGKAPFEPPLAPERLRSLFGRSLHLREVSAGGCNGCDLEAAAAGNPNFDFQRFGIDFVASPRHADGLLVTGPVSKNMREGLVRTCEAVPEPRIVIAVGACAAGGGIFRGSSAVEDGVGGVLPVDLYIPGCPPHPLSILYGIAAFFGRYPARSPRATSGGNR
jgi:Ni,Fe-hydrogenase III small subunit/NAD-dependent dihydropyrimidine dehydrogenase PreA subunit